MAERHTDKTMGQGKRPYTEKYRFGHALEAAIMKRRAGKGPLTAEDAANIRAGKPVSYQAATEPAAGALIAKTAATEQQTRKKKKVTLGPGSSNGKTTLG